MKVLALVLALVLVASISASANLTGWFVQSVTPYSAIIINRRLRAIQCYIYYSDGSFINLYVPRSSSSHEFPSDNITEVECF